MERERDFYKEFVHVIIEADQSRGLHSVLANWKADGVAPVLSPAGLVSRKSPFKLQSESRKKLIISVQGKSRRRNSLLL